MLRVLKRCEISPGYNENTVHTNVRRFSKAAELTARSWLKLAKQLTLKKITRLQRLLAFISTLKILPKVIKSFDLCNLPLYSS